MKMLTSIIIFILIGSGLLLAGDVSPTKPPVVSGNSIKKTPALHPLKKIAVPVNSAGRTPSIINTKATRNATKPAEVKPAASPVKMTLVMVLTADHKGKLSKRASYLVNKAMPEEKKANDGKYQLVISDKALQPVYQAFFDVSVETTECPQPDWFDQVTGEQIFFPKTSMTPQHPEEIIFKIIGVPFNKVFSQAVVIDTALQSRVLEFDLSYLVE